MEEAVCEYKRLKGTIHILQTYVLVKESCIYVKET